MEEKQETLRTNLDETLDKKVSYLKNAWSSVAKEITIREVFNEIKTDMHKEQILKLRALKKDNKDAYDYHKKNLPGITFCASFNDERKKTRLKNYNAIVVLDIDKLNRAQLNNAKECFLKEDIVFSFWESPSQEGIKGLVKLKFALELDEAAMDLAHKQAFEMLSDFFL